MRTTRIPDGYRDGDGDIASDPDTDGTFLVSVEDFISDEGTVVVFEGKGGLPVETIRFAVDHRMAQTIVDALGPNSLEDPVLVRLEPWQVLSRHG